MLHALKFSFDSKVPIGQTVETQTSTKVCVYKGERDSNGNTPYFVRIRGTSLTEQEDLDHAEAVVRKHIEECQTLSLPPNLLKPCSKGGHPLCGHIQCRTSQSVNPVKRHYTDRRRAPRGEICNCRSKECQKFHPHRRACVDGLECRRKMCLYLHPTVAGGAVGVTESAREERRRALVKK
ncbi:hypothetical protein BC832DRAFT_250878 [Gaertneriomyces semiglobifer]|nr:hypothetical protein BC832DRAFT_250878 [Gaertneriomyces semiglobifer]